MNVNTQMVDYDRLLAKADVLNAKKNEILTNINVIKQSYEKITSDYWLGPKSAIFAEKIAQFFAKNENSGAILDNVESDFDGLIKFIKDACGQVEETDDAIGQSVK